MAEKIGEIKQKLEETDISLLPAFVEEYKLASIPILIPEPYFSLPKYKTTSHAFP